MHSDLAPEYGLWLESVVVLAAGTVVIVGLAVLVSRLVGSAVWRRTIWQVATLGLWGLVLVEWTGTGAGLVRLCSLHAQTAETTTAALPAPVDQPAEKPSPVVAAKRSVQRPRGIELPTFSPGMGEFTGPGLAAFTDIGPVPAESWDMAPFGEFDFGREDGYGDFAADFVAASSAPPAVISQVRPFCVWWPGLVWLLGTAVVAGRAVFARLLLCVLRRRQVPVVDAGLCECVRGLARRLGIRRPVGVLQSGGLRAPVAFGSFRPTVLLPTGFAEEFDRRQQEAMLAHELAHLRAGDPAWQLAADLACALLWWHPLAWWSRRRLRSAGEVAADEASLLVPDGPGVLASCLVAMGRRFSSRPRLGWLSIEGPGFRSALGRRVERLLNLRAGPWRAPGRGRSVCVKTLFPVALVIVAITCTAWARAQATLNEGGTTMKVFSSSWRRSLAAVALVTLWGVTSSDAVAAEGQEGEGPKLEGKLVLEGEGEGEVREREAPKREEGEVREREAPKREEGEVREREAPKREEGEVREREAPKREGEGEAREREAPKREEGEVREREAAERERAEAREREARERPDQPRGEGEERIMALRREHGALEERAAQIRRELEGVLREHGEGHPAVRELAGELERIQNQMREIAAAARGGEPRPDQPRPDQPRPDQPRPDQPRPDQPRLDQPRPDQPRPDRPAPGPDMERRIQHLRVAVENLRAAGMPDQAEMLAQQVERMMRGGQVPDGPRPEGPERMINELRGQVDQLRRDMAEIRGALRELLERER